MVELREEDVPSYKNFMRMERSMFQELVDRLTPRLEKQDTWYRLAMETGLKLAVTLRHLATGETYRSMQYGWRVAHNTISILINEVCEAIIAEYVEEIVHCPATQQEWQHVAHHFGASYPGCIGWQTCPDPMSEEWWLQLLQLQEVPFIVLMGLVDADYKFLDLKNAPSLNSFKARHRKTLP